MRDFGFTFALLLIGKLLSVLPTSADEGKLPRETKGLSPRIECDAEMLSRARERIANKIEPFHSHWTSLGEEFDKAMRMEPKPSHSRDSLVFHGQVQAQGIAARLLAYKWRLEGDQEAGAHAIELLVGWASSSPLPGTDFDPKVRHPNSGMDVARGILPFVVAYDLLKGHEALTVERRTQIEAWFRALVPVIKEGIRRWEANGDFGGQHFQNHHVSHTLGIAVIGAVLGDEKLVQFALDSEENPKDFKELVAGLILMHGDKPHGGLRGKPLHPGEMNDRSRTTTGHGLNYCHLSMTLLMYCAEVLSRQTEEDWVNWKAPGGECLRLSFTFYSDFWRLRNANLHGGYYWRDQPSIRDNRPFIGIFEVALHHWPEVPNLRAAIRSIDRQGIKPTWLCYYGLPLLTHGVGKP